MSVTLKTITGLLYVDWIQSKHYKVDEMRTELFGRKGRPY